VEDLEKMLKGTRFTSQDVAAVFDQATLASYFGVITKEELLSLLFT
jgi:hypothetical protein